MKIITAVFGLIASLSQARADAIAPTMPPTSADLARSILDKYVGCKSIEAFDGAGDGVRDNSSALSAAIAGGSVTGKICLKFGNGIYRFASSPSIGLPSGGSLTIVGEGPDVSILDFTSSNGMSATFVDVTNSIHLDNVSFVTEGVGTATALTIEQTGSVCCGAQQAQSSLVNVVFRGSDGYVVKNYWRTALEIIKASNFSFLNTSFVGPAPTGGDRYTTIGVGVQIHGTQSVPPVQFSFNGISVAYVGVEIKYGSYTQGVSIGGGSNFTGGEYGVLVDSNATGISQLTVANSQFNMKTAAVIQNAAVPGTSIVGNYIIIPSGGNGVLFPHAAFFSIAGNIFQGLGATSSTNGIVIQQTEGTPGLGGVIGSNTFANLQTAIWLQSLSSNTTVAKQSFYGNGANMLNEALTGIGGNDLGDIPTTYGALPRCGAFSQGLTAVVADARVNYWGANIASGGGSMIVRAHCNGTNWTVIGK